MPKRTVPPIEPRVETGGVRFGDDWPGYFIRGDMALHLAGVLQQAIHTLRTQEPLSPIFIARIEDFANAIEHDVPLPHWYQKGDSSDA